MAVIPRYRVLTNASVDVLNAIRNSASINYQNYVPVATPDAESVRKIGGIIMDYPALQNEFLNALINRIGRVMYTNKAYRNPWAMFKKGELAFGETVEDIFVGLAKVFEYDPDEAESTYFKREKPDVKAAYYITNYQKFYKVTVEDATLRSAFLSWEGVSNMISSIIDSMYKSAEYDEYQAMKYMLAQHILNGQMTPVDIDTVTTDNLKSIVATVRGTASKMKFMSANYNAAGVPNHSNDGDLYIIVDADFEASMDVEVLASAFNMSKAEFIGKRVVVDGFGNLDNARLGEIFGRDPNYTEIGAESAAALNAIPAMIVDKDFFMIFDKLTRFGEGTYNEQGLYWNYFLHTWKVLAISPFAQNALFVPGTAAVTEITPSVNSVEIAAGSSVQLTATVASTGFAPTGLIWSSSNEDITVSQSGVVTVSPDAESGATITIKSAYTPTVTASVTVTLAE